MAPTPLDKMSTKSQPAPPYPHSQGPTHDEDPGIGPSRQAPSPDPEAYAGCAYCAQISPEHVHHGPVQTVHWAQEPSIPMTSLGGDEKTAPENRERPYPVLTAWGFEILVMVMAIVSLAGLFVILNAVNGKIIAAWPWESLRLETVMSFMVTVTVVSVAYVIVQVLGQAGWSWFGHTLHRRPLYDLDVFNRGGDGILASLQLLLSVFRSGLSGVRTAAGIMAICAALITILSFAGGPFAQQALRTVKCSWRSGPGLGSIPVSNFVPANDDYFVEYANDYLVFDLGPEMKAVMLNALANPRAAVESAVAADCPSGHCNFRDYGTGITHSTIGLCSTCIDLGAHVTDTEVAGPKLGLYLRNYSLPWDGSVDAPKIDRMENWGSYIVPQSTEKNPWMSVTMRGSFDYAKRGWTAEFWDSGPDALFNITIMAASDAPCTVVNDGVKFCPWQIRNDMVPENNFTSLVAVGCRLYPCLKNFRAEVRSGVLTEELVSTVPARTNSLEKLNRGGLQLNLTALQDPCFLAGGDDNGKKVFTSDELGQVPPAQNRTFSRITTAQSTVVQAPSDCLYHASGVYLQAMKDHLIDLMAGRCRYSGLGTFQRPAKVTCGDKWWLDPLYASRNASVASISAAMEGLAVAVTNQFRRTGSGPHRPRAEGDATGLTVRGDAWDDTMCFSLRWEWLLLPAGLVASTLVLLSAAVLRSYMEPEQPVWKASVLPMVLYGLARRGGGSDEGYARRDLMELRKVEQVSKNLKVRFDKLAGSGFAS
ncbi:hypothetical protein PpBr36_02509 [Pyricularia pennisetigena]|uniref:hypothetical protein n=1 Tax=Pyricularia pennisetigena TaxID=1578925 RepID=UPI0011527DDF|nr:hypothetical protein PpBr36_02509 [Pyricularia pennisetigena]TLS30639.1 hypothetical protein PpBr36_02509 [Pyricularia pennisetigena]